MTLCRIVPADSLGYVEDGTPCIRADARADDLPAFFALAQAAVGKREDEG